MKKAQVFCCAIAAMVMFAGCSTYSRGYLTGELVYNAYERVSAEKNDDTFDQRVAELWAKFDAIQETSELVDTWTELETQFDSIINDQDIKQWQKVILIKAKDAVADQVTQVIESKFTSDSSAVEFLVAAREAIRNCIAEEATAKEIYGE